MFGVMFRGHPDHRRLLTDYGFEGHPLRKDFPLVGNVELHYDGNEAKIKQTAVALVQELREYECSSKWKGYASAALPGDEKKSV